MEKEIYTEKTLKNHSNFPFQYNQKSLMLMDLIMSLNPSEITLICNQDLIFQNSNTAYNMCSFKLFFKNPPNYHTSKGEMNNMSC